MSRRTIRQRIDRPYESQYLTSSTIRGKTFLTTKLRQYDLNAKDIERIHSSLKKVHGAKQANSLDKYIGDLVESRYNDVVVPGNPDANLDMKARYSRTKADIDYKNNINLERLKRKTQLREERHYRSVNAPDPYTETGKSFTNASTRDTVAQATLKQAKNPNYRKDLSQKAERAAQRRAARAAFRKNEKVLGAGSNKIKKLFEGKKAAELMSKISNKGWFAKGALAAGAWLAFNVVSDTIKGFNPQPALPSHYERGYDVMKETLTDFGSPVKLLNTVKKTVTPYFSSVRRGKKTSINSIIHRNIALKSHKNAIGHTAY